MGIFWIYLREEVKDRTGGEYSPNNRDLKLMHREPGKRYTVEFDNIGGLNLWKHPYQYFPRGRIRDLPANIEFKRILELNISSRFTDDKGRDVVKVTREGAEAALNNTVWLKHWHEKTGKKEFYVIIIPQHIYSHRLCPSMYSGWVRYNPRLVRVPQLVGKRELSTVNWTQQKLGSKTIRDVFE